MNIAFVPVRCGSKSIPFKNIKLFCGKPLVYWCLKALEYSDSVDCVFVATDCKEIREVVLSFNFRKVKIFKRNSRNASDTASTESVLLEFIGKKNFLPSDLFLLVQATSPLLQAKDVDGAIKKYIDTGSDSLLSCVRTKRFFWDNNIPINYNPLNRPRRQDFKGILMENGALYISSVEAIKNNKNRLSGKLSIFVMDEYTGIELDEEDDWSIAEKLMYRHIISKSRIKEIKVVLSDVDGTLTDSGMYYGENGEELKKFNTHDGKGFEILKKAGIKTGIITSENTKIIQNRAHKLKVDYVYQNVQHNEKLNVAKEICYKEKIKLENIAYIGDDINCKELLTNVGLAACPSDAVNEIKEIFGIHILEKKGGHGVVREFIDKIITNYL
tara:strand:+ start:438 stop:1592 length:1155 start_codon:yes stop_codon:yes gene_type:complete